MYYRFTVSTYLQAQVIFMVPNSTNGSERRKYPRAKFQETITVHRVVESKSGNVYEVQGEGVLTKAQDLSEGGIRIEALSQGSFSKILKLRIKVPKNGDIDVYTKVAWENKGHFGLQFVALEDEFRRHIKGIVQKAV